MNTKNINRKSSTKPRESRSSKMADGTKVVVCDVLCFFRHKFVKTPLKALKSVLMDFYSTEVLSCAKKQLLDDISAIDTTVKFPHVPQRRDGDNRIVNEVDDIMILYLLC